MKRIINNLNCCEPLKMLGVALASIIHGKKSCVNNWSNYSVICTSISLLNIINISGAIHQIFWFSGVFYVEDKFGWAVGSLQSELCEDEKGDPRGRTDLERATVWGLSILHPDTCAMRLCKLSASDPFSSIYFWIPATVLWEICTASHTTWLSCCGYTQ